MIEKMRLFYMRHVLRQKFELFGTGMLQVYFVAIQTVFLSKYYYGGVLIVSFMISFIWCFNVKRIAFGSIWDKVIYSIGATTGSILGLLTTKLF